MFKTSLSVTCSEAVQINRIIRDRTSVDIGLALCDKLCFLLLT